jgi:hypothetical protein
MTTINYNNGKIYKIEAINGEEGDIYIGSTTKQYLSQRMTKHREDYNRWNQGKYHKTMLFNLFENYGIENCKIILLENCPCDSKDQLHARESHYIKSLNCINKCIPSIRYSCECGSIFRTTDRARHLKTQKHQAYVASSKCNLEK